MGARVETRRRRRAGSGCPQDRAFGYRAGRAELGAGRRGAGGSPGGRRSEGAARRGVDRRSARAVLLARLPLPWRASGGRRAGQSAGRDVVIAKESTVDELATAPWGAGKE